MIKENIESDPSQNSPHSYLVLCQIVSGRKISISLDILIQLRKEAESLIFHMPSGEFLKFREVMFTFKKR